jgi:hypothetical protein
MFAAGAAARVDGAIDAAVDSTMKNAAHGRGVFDL